VNYLYDENSGQRPMVVVYNRKYKKYGNYVPAKLPRRYEI